ncbi:unnamed protein product, partial [Polarella glacialis]
MVEQKRPSLLAGRAPAFRQHGRLRLLEAKAQVSPEVLQAVAGGSCSRAYLVFKLQYRGFATPWASCNGTTTPPTIATTATTTATSTTATATTATTQTATATTTATATATTATTTTKTTAIPTATTATSATTLKENGFLWLAAEGGEVPWEWILPGAAPPRLEVIRAYVFVADEGLSVGQNVAAESLGGVEQGQAAVGGRAVGSFEVSLLHLQAGSATQTLTSSPFSPAVKGGDSKVCATGKLTLRVSWEVRDGFLQGSGALARRTMELFDEIDDLAGGAEMPAVAADAEMPIEGDEAAEAVDEGAAEVPPEAEVPSRSQGADAYCCPPPQQQEQESSEVSRFLREQRYRGSLSSEAQRLVLLDRLGAWPANNNKNNNNNNNNDSNKNNNNTNNNDNNNINNNKNNNSKNNNSNNDNNNNNHNNNSSAGQLREEQRSRSAPSSPREVQWRPPAALHQAQQQRQ